MSCVIKKLIVSYRSFTNIVGWESGDLLEVIINSSVDPDSDADLQSVFIAHQHTDARRSYSKSVRPSVCLSVSSGIR